MPSTALSKLEPLASQSLAEQIADQIRTAIRDGKYEPGARLVERRLAGELGVSHIPIREALARLADEGLVERLPRRGSRVASLGPKELQELSELRALLERFVARRVQERLTSEGERELRKIVASMRRSAGRGEVRRLLDLDQEFHERLWQLADHDLLGEFVGQLRRRIAAFLRAATTALRPDELEAHAATHDELLDAIVSGSARRAERAMADHIETAAKRLRRSIVAPLAEGQEPEARDGDG